MNDSALLEFPLFLGMTASELASFRSQGMLSVGTVTKSSTLVKVGNKCERLIIITEGTIRIVTESDDKSYAVEENVKGPMIIQPERLFGLNQYHTSTYTSMTLCHYVTIDKNDVVKMMEKSMVFRINFLNVLSTMNQRVGRRMWHQQSEDVVQRIIRFAKDHCQYPAGRKYLRMGMSEMAREIGCSRLEVSQALHQLENQDRVRMHRMTIEIPELRLFD